MHNLRIACALLSKQKEIEKIRMKFDLYRKKMPTENKIEQ